MKTIREPYPKMKSSSNRMEFESFIIVISTYSKRHSQGFRLYCSFYTTAQTEKAQHFLLISSNRHDHDHSNLHKHPPPWRPKFWKFLGGGCLIKYFRNFLWVYSDKDEKRGGIGPTTRKTFFQAFLRKKHPKTFSDNATALSDRPKVFREHKSVSRNARIGLYP